MDRIAAARPGQMILTLYGAASSPTAVTVTGVSRRTGATVLAARAADAVAGEPTETWQVQLSGTEVTDPDVVDTVWTATIDGVDVTFPAAFEFVGDHYAPLAKLASRVGASATTQDLLDALAQVAERIETYTGWTWVPRWRQAVIYPDRHGTARLPRPHVPIRQLLTAVDDRGTVVNPTYWAWTPLGVVHTGRRAGRVTVTWEAGEPAPPADLAGAALDAAADAVRASSIRDRRNRADLGEGQFPFQHADLARRRPFGIDGVDAIVNGHVKGVMA